MFLSGSALVSHASRTCDDFSYGDATCNVVVAAEVQAPFTDKLKADLLDTMKEKKPTQLQTFGNNSDQKIGDEVETFLKDNEYTVRRVVMKMTTPAIPRPYSVTKGADKYILIVAPSFH